MKLSTKFSLLAAGVMFILFISARLASDLDRNVAFQDADIVIPENIQAIIDQKCYTCHSVNGAENDEEGIEALDFDNLSQLSLARQIHVMEEIIEVMEDGSMPPPEEVDHHPELVMTEEQVDALIEWADQTANSLLSGSED